MTNKYIKSLEILEVNQNSIIVRVEFDIKEMVADFIGYTNNIAQIIKELAEKMGNKVLNQKGANQ